MFLILYLAIILPHCYQIGLGPIPPICEGSARKVMEHNGYGIYFEYVADIYIKSLTETYTYTWALKYPHFSVSTAPLMTCNQYKHNITHMYCNFINDLIKETNQEHLETVSTLIEDLHSAYQSFDLITTLDAFVNGTESLKVEHKEEEEREEDGNDNNWGHFKNRKKRQLTPDTDLPHTKKFNVDSATSAQLNKANSILDDATKIHVEDEKDLKLPGWMDDHKLDEIESYLPTFQSGQILSSIGNLPGRDTVNTLSNHVRSLGAAAYYEEHHLVVLEKYGGAILSTLDQKVTNLDHQGQIIIDIIKATENAIEDHEKFFENVLESIESKLLYSEGFVTIYIQQIEKIFNNMQSILTTERELVYSWTRGLNQLHAQVFPYETLITYQMLKNAITFIHEKVNKESIFNHVQLPYLSPDYFQGLQKKTAYMFTTTHLIISFEFPLVMRDVSGGDGSGSGTTVGTFVAYRARISPVPITAGMAELPYSTLQAKGPSDDGYVKIVEVPEYIAVDSVLSQYVEFDHSQYMSCKGLTDAQKICGQQIPLPKSRGNAETRLGCLMAIFLDDHVKIKESCVKAYDKNPPPGSITKIYGTDYYEITKDPDDEAWEVICPHKSSVHHTKTCSQCFIKVPCGCFLKGAHYQTPVTWHESCTMVDVDGNPDTSDVTYIYSQNNMALAEFTPKEDMDKVRSWSKLINQQWPPIHIPRINFTLNATSDKSLEIGRKFGQDFVKGINLAQAGDPIFHSNIDQALNKSINFTDVRTGRVLKPLKPVLDIIDSFFGRNVQAFFAFIISAPFLTILLFIIGLLYYLPKSIHIVSSHVKYNKQKYKHYKEKKYLREKAMCKQVKYQKLPCAAAKLVTNHQYGYDMGRTQNNCAEFYDDRCINCDDDYDDCNTYYYHQNDNQLTAEQAIQDPSLALTIVEEYD